MSPFIQMLAKILMAALGVLSSVPGVLAAQPFAHATPKIDCLIVSNASIELDQNIAETPRTTFARQLRRANQGHEIKRGNFYVLALRQYQDGGSGVDAAYFSKTTLEISAAELDIALGKTVRFSVSRGFHSEGGIGFVHRGQYWSARNPISAISIARTAAGLTLRLQGTFVASRESDGDLKNVKLDMACPVRPIAVDALDPWEGKLGTDWKSFAPNQE